MDRIRMARLQYVNSSYRIMGKNILNTPMRFRVANGIAENHVMKGHSIVTYRMVRVMGDFDTDQFRRARHCFTCGLLGVLYST